ncbi:biotin transporter BioY [Lachnoclostridium sp. An181]|uniref:biotin transporter BioY n=1 Tax=Lachnoclostridium sp. An181 TaxID=1965575 RepID=UPI000B3884C0|nr:biotin transporter BioY [Lachnoclostridium sp. An181]OUP49872.1 biotin transporter BioY [Lachnoclostridium sp. An181]
MIKTETKVRDMVLGALFTALICLGAFMQITIPLEPFPMHFTMQFYFVLLAGLLLGGRRGCVSVCIYLSIGLCGIPIFASGGGPSYILRPTFGFLISFALASWIVGKLTEIWRPDKTAGYLFICLFGFAAMYVCGMCYFYIVSNYIIHIPVSWGLVFINCFAVTAAGDLALCILAAVSAKQLYAIMRKVIR